MIRTPLAVFVLASLLGWLGGTAHRKTEEGNRALDQGELDDALADYTEAQVHAPDSPRLYYDIGNVLYRQGDYEGAADAYRRALLEGSPELAPLAAYNLGNARFQQHEFQDAIDAYRRTLEASPDDVDAKRNLELALRELQEQQQQQQQQKQQQEKDDEDQDQDEKEQQQKQPGSQDQQQPNPSGAGEQDEQAGGATDDSKPGEPQGERMTPEEARRLLDSLAEDERRTLEQEAKQKALRATPREKDW